MAAGIFLNNCDFCSISDSIVSNITGGAGGAAGRRGVGGTGGIGAGIWLSGSTGTSISSVAIANVDGGEGGLIGVEGLGATGIGQVGFGIYLEDDSLDTTIEETLLQDEPVVYVYGQSGVIVTGLQLTKNVNPTNLGKVVVLQSTNVDISKTSVSGYNGSSGGLAAYDGKSGDGGKAVGVLLQGLTAFTLSEVAVGSIAGGIGGASPPSGTGGTGGTASGILIDNCSLGTVSNVSVRDVNSGNGGPLSYNGAHGQAGTATGIAEGGGQSLKIEGALVHDIDAGTGGVATLGDISCIALNDVAQPTLTGLTCHEIGQNTDGLAAGVTVGQAQSAAVQAGNSIFSNIHGYCLHSDEANAPTILSASYSDLHNCSTGAAYNSTVAGNCLELVPLFVDPEANDFHLQPDSPCIDAGKSSSKFVKEPEPNGCRVNIGHYGNTAEATSKPFAGHCPDGGDCQTNCSKYECGSDGCGGSCDSCNGVDEVCSTDHLCCIPDCAGKLCGDDGCGGSCGGCPEGETCDLQFECCETECDGKCGHPNGCGGTCDNCSNDEVCLPSGYCATPTTECAGPIVCSQMTDMPEPRNSGTMAAYNGELHYLGGLSSDGIGPDSLSDNVFSYSSAGNSWFSDHLPPIPQPLSHMGSSTYLEDLILVGGYNSVPVDKAYLYSNLQAAWVENAVMPFPAFGMAVGVIELNGKIFAVGGTYDGSKNNDFAQVYDPAQDQWSQTGNMVEGRTMVTAVVHQGSLYAFGGQVGWGTVKKHAERYDEQADSWIVLGNMPVGLSKAIAVSIGDYIYLLLGEQAYNTTPTTEVFRYDPQADSWELFAELSDSMTYSHRAGIQMGNSVYLFGGKRFDQVGSTTARVDVVVFE